MSRQTFVALLRGINVSGKNKLPMADLRALCIEIGCENVQTYIQSGNLAVTSALAATELEQRLEQAIEQQCRLSVPVLVRTASDWSRYVDSNPFPEESKRHANRVVLTLSKHPPDSDVAAKLNERAAHGEHVLREGDALWIHYPQGIARSKLVPAVIERLAGSPVTARNWRTVAKLHEMSGGK
ncbi:DUF1697 domain-containing protein [Lentisalinibacter orientalis]|uniref:DUF1697 domain-containing protein n=1 Tax=Lentisalinibacter orientalis TaxID=2992241 RepID=UPI003865931A